MKYLKAVVLNSEVFVTKLILVERQNDVFLAKIVVQYLALHSFDGSGENDSSMLLVRDEVQLLEVNRKQNAHVAFCWFQLTFPPLPFASVSLIHYCSELVAVSYSRCFAVYVNLGKGTFLALQYVYLC